MKRSCCVLVFLILAVALMWSAPQPEKEKTVSADLGGPLTAYDPVIDVTTWRIDSPSSQWVEGNTPDDNIWYDYYREKLGINLKNVWSVVTEADQKISVSIASGDLPDIMKVTFSQLKQLAENDLVADLKTYYNDIASDLVKNLLATPNLPPPFDSKYVQKPIDWARFGWQGVPEILEAVTIGGKMAAMPQQAIIDQSWQLWLLRRDWLKNVDLPAPKTMDELINVIRAFSLEDPDGNGKDDTFGIGIAKDLLTTPAFEIVGFASGYHAYPTIWIEDESGKLVYGSIQPEMKQALASLRKLYAEGLMDKEFPVKDFTKVGEGVAAGKIGLFGGRMWNPLNPVQGSVTNDEDADWTSIPLVSIDSEPARPFVRQFVPQGYSYYAASKDSEHPEALIKIMNLLAAWRDEVIYGENPSEEAQKLNWIILPDGRSQEVWIDWNPISGPRRETNVPIHLSVKAAILQNDTSMLFSLAKERYEQVMDYRAGNRQMYGLAGVFGPEGTQDRIVEYRNKNLGVLNGYYGPPTETETRRGATLDSLELQTFTSIIIGSEPLEAFDTFVEDWKRLGGDDWTNEVNAWAAER